MIRLDDPCSLSLLFHLNSEPWLNDDAYHRGAPGPHEHVGPSGAAVSLPHVTPGPLDELAARRRSCRAYERAQLPLATVAAFLASAYGIVEAVPGAGSTRLLRRTVPSAGGLFPLELLVFLRRVDDLDDGVYRYDPVGHVLELLDGGDQFATVLAPTLYAYPFIEDANGFLAIAAVFRRTQQKYGPRGYRYILLEAGHVGQHLALRGVELGLGTLCIGGFTDAALNASLGLDVRRAGVVYGVGFGLARGDDHPPTSDPGSDPRREG
ncbi:MAG: nitroreductase [Ilumatobacteraceae bacterium]|nr:nitroreductase [Ilumatobacteraceae bacterium]